MVEPEQRQEIHRDLQRFIDTMQAGGSMHDLKLDSILHMDEKTFADTRASWEEQDAVKTGKIEGLGKPREDVLFNPARPHYAFCRIQATNEDDNPDAVRDLYDQYVISRGNFYATFRAVFRHIRTVLVEVETANALDAMYGAHHKVKIIEDAAIAFNGDIPLVVQGAMGLRLEQ